MVKLFTSRLMYSGKDKINTTVKSGDGLGDVLAPTWTLVAGHKLYQAQQRQDVAEVARWQHSKITGYPTEPLNEAEYTERYLKILRARYAENKQPFLDILTQPQATITCYCARDRFATATSPLMFWEKSRRSTVCRFSGAAKSIRVLERSG